MITNIEIKEKLQEVFADNGLEIFDGEDDFQLEMDSLRFIAIVVAIENAFSIEVPDEYLSDRILSSFHDFYDMAINLLN